ncbi:ABC transporter substrate-binding protein [Clostridium beijerinckii]|uniref:ABC transporter substrate-binding protein n=1 Tax=Clostridium beijerinckii TaxID=1520 RepID=UPI00242D19FD|nr:extracellular solute-binding protein [Clostridium beijerinckii]MDG5856829.1 extracellular solute-binding protein [Clostridium beijerinckii]
MKLTKIMCLLTSTVMAVTFFTGCGSTKPSSTETSANKTEKITLMTVDTTFNEDFQKYIEKAEKATGIKIDTIACPTNTDDRQAKITTILSSKDSSVDVITINDEMISAFKNTGFLEPLQNTVMKNDVVSQFPKGYIKDLIQVGDNIYSVPMYMEILGFWVDQSKVKALGLDAIKTKEDFEKYVKAYSKDGKYGYGGAWEKTYVFNEIGTFVNLFGGDYYDWTNPKTKEAVKFMHDMAKNGETPIAQLADQYDPMMQKFFDDDYASIFMYTGAMKNFVNSGRYGENGITLAPMPTFEKNSAYIACWNYVLNSASENKEAAIKFLNYAASPQGEKDYYEMTSRLPARSDVINDSNFKIEGLSAIKGYLQNTELHGRPMAPQAMEFISSMGSLFQRYVSDEISLDEFCQKAQVEVNKYAKK